MESGKMNLPSTDIFPGAAKKRKKKSSNPMESPKIKISLDSNNLANPASSANHFVSSMDPSNFPPDPPSDILITNAADQSITASSANHIGSRKDPNNITLAPFGVFDP